MKRIFLSIARSPDRTAAHTWRLRLTRNILPAFGILSCLSALSVSAQVSLASAVDLALRNSNAVKMAASDVQRATSVLSETKDVFIPSFLLGSSVGYSYGFPVGQPSIYNVSSQSLLYTFSQPDYIRAARAGLHSAELALEDSRQQVVLDASLDYIQLDSDRREIDVLDQENAAASRLSLIQQQRVDAGLESRTDLLRTRLVAAQVRLKLLHLQDDAEVLRQRLAHLTGLPPDSLATESKTIPPAPDFGADGSPLIHATLTALNGNQGVQAAYATAKSRMYQAFGDARQNYRPQFGFGAQYSRFAEFNNYQDYYNHFQHNNFEVGLQITLPLYDASRKAKERESRAEAAHAAAQADQVRDQTSESIVQLRKSLTELSAQKDVVEIQGELAQAQLDAVLTQLQSAAATPGAAPLTPKDEQQARIEERRRAADVLEANFELTKAQLALLRATGAIENWYKTQPQP